MLTNSDLATICANSYTGPWSGNIALDLKYDLLPRRDELVVVMPGTDPANALNLIRDLSALPMWTQGIGFLHEGFASGALSTWAKVNPIMSKTGLITYTGHSLAAACALIMGGLHALHRPDQPFRVVAIAPPRTCVTFASRLSWLLKRGAVPPVAFSRDGDLVPHLPLAPLYRHAVTPTLLIPLIPDPLKAHAVLNYVAGIKALNV